jgi:glutamine cyclotransferase
MPVTTAVIRRTPWCLTLLVFFLTGLPTSAAPVDSYKVVARFPHSTENYTEGFFYLDGMFYEGTGRAGRSAVMAVDPKTGKASMRRDLPPEYFGEGIVDWGPYILEWTWKSHICFVYDRLTFQPLISSDGTATLRFRDPNTFQETHHIVVKDGNKVIDNLHELEFVKGEIYANIWHSDRIARISPQDGHVIAWIDLTGLLPSDQKIDSEAVLNGIAYDSQHDRLFVTGKEWPTIFEIKIVHLPHEQHHTQQFH